MRKSVMKTGIIISNGKARIKLTPENTFEETLIEDFKNGFKSYEVETMARSERDHYGLRHIDHCITIDITKKL